MSDGNGSDSILVNFKDVRLGYGRLTVLDAVNLAICKGDFLGVVGPNGSGKTTLLKALLGMLSPMTGEIQWRVPRSTVRFGYVPQRELLDELYPLTVLDIVLMSRTSLRCPWRRYSNDDRECALWALKQVGITDLSQVPYRLLSGGQKQRTLIARALAAEPTLLVLDEPTNGLDLPTEHSIMELIRRLHEEHQITVVFVTHLLNVVINYASRIAIVHNGRVHVGVTAEMVSPEHLREAYGIETCLGTVNGKRVVMVQS